MNGDWVEMDEEAGGKLLNRMQELESGVRAIRADLEERVRGAVWACAKGGVEGTAEAVALRAVAKQTAVAVLEELYKAWFGDEVGA